jgi:uncharacterized membrane protein YhhN
MLRTALWTCACVAALLVADGVGVPYVGGVAKMAASTGFLLLAVQAGALHSRYGIALLAGLFFSWWGDLFLIWSGTFLFGLVAFLLGHLCYSAAFLLHGVRWGAVLLALLLLLLWVLPVIFWLSPHLSGEKAALAGPVYVYMAVITAMVALSVGARYRGGVWAMVIGAVLFYVSDLCVARQAFVEPSYLNRLMGLPLYFGGQLVLAASPYWLAARQRQGV